mgnify:CR=1 FL=1
MQDSTEYNTNLNHYYKLLETEQKIGMESTRLLWTFSGGAVALSITLVSGVFGNILQYGLHYLFFSWVAFILCSILVLLSLDKSQKAFQFDIESLISEMSGKEWKEYDEKRGKCNKLAAKIESIARILFLIGIISLLFFIYVNISVPEVLNGSEKENIPKTISQGGFPPQFKEEIRQEIAPKTKTRSSAEIRDSTETSKASTRQACREEKR